MSEAPALPDVRQSLRWWVLITVIIGTFLGRLDQTIVNLALPKIIDDFHITVTSAGWIATAYILANAVFVPVWGKLGDTWGRKKVYLLGFIGFILASALAGCAWDLGSMIVFRIFQAVAGSADYPTGMAILAVIFTDSRERGQALGIWSASFAAAAVFGPLIGGPLIDTFGWRSVFLVNIPVGIIGALMAIFFVVESVSPKASRYFDWYGALTLGISLAALVLVLDKGTDWGWLDTSSLICYAVTAIFFYLFILIESKHPEPIIRLQLFFNSTFVNALSNNFIIFMAMMGSVFLVPVFAQTFLGYDATGAGYLFIPMAFMIMFAAPLGGKLKMQPRYIIALSTAIAACGIYFLSYIDIRSTAWDICIPLAVMAFGIGLGMSQRTTAVASVVSHHEMGMASSILALTRNIAGAFGIALLGTLLNSSIENNILSAAQQYHLPEGADALVRGTATQLIILRGEVDAYSAVFSMAAFILVCGAIAALFMHIERVRHLPKELEGE